MTKTLTEQWKDGKLPENTYYVQFICGRYGIYEFEQFKGFGFDNDLAYIKEVLAPVPSYDEYKRLQEQLKEANEVIKKFEETEIGHKQKDGTYMLTVCGVIIDPEKRPTSALVETETYVYDPRPLTTYLKKWGVK